MFKVTCGKCKGTGIVDCYRYNDAGVCYDCKGVGHTMRKTKPINLIEYNVTAVIKVGFQNSGNRGGLVINAKNEIDAIKKAKLHPDCYEMETIQAEAVQ